MAWFEKKKRKVNDENGMFKDDLMDKYVSYKMVACSEFVVLV